VRLLDGKRLIVAVADSQPTVSASEVPVPSSILLAGEQTLYTIRDGFQPKEIKHVVPISACAEGTRRGTNGVW
jgi:hypothetical protein